MDIASQPLVHIALGLAGMFLCAFLFDRAYKFYISDAQDGPEPAKPSLTRALINMAGAIGLGVVLWLVLYKTNLLVADLFLLAALAGFAILSYRIRLRPLLARGLTMPHFAVLVIALALWAMPILWFMHLHLARSYGVA